MKKFASCAARSAASPLSPKRLIMVLGCIVVSSASVTHVQAEDIPILYNGDTGPAHWYTLDPEWAQCEGATAESSQSPVDINRVRRDRRLKPLEMQTFPTTINIFNNGHTIEQTYDESGSSIYFNDVEYALQQFHFHTLSEHTFGGQHAPLEMHAVYSEPGGKILVVGQLFKLSKRSSKFLQSLIDAGLPRKDGDVSMKNVPISLDDGLVNKRSYYTYSGSLTTPPCSEVVTWVILKKPAVVSREQYDAFRDILGNNFRPTQKLNNRVVYSTGGRKYSHGKYGKSTAR